MKGLLLIVVVAGALALVAAEPSPMPRATPDSVGLSAEHLQQATALLRQYVADHKIAGAVAAVARKGKIAYLEPVGLQDLQTRAPMTERSLFRIYSMTKSVTAVAVMMLHEEGRFQLTDPVSKYLPEFANVTVLIDPQGAATRKASRPVTIADLLLHTSGLSHRTSDLYKREQVRARSIALPQFITNIVKAPLMEDPGTRFRYSEGTTVLGRLVEVWSGKAFDAFLQDRVLTPLGMTDTTFWVTPDAVSRLATVYSPAPTGGVQPFEVEEVPFTQKPALVEGAVGLVSTVPDYLRFSQMLLNQGELSGVRVLKAKTVEMIVANSLSPAILKERGGSMGWGLANVNVQMNAASPNVGEYGWDGTAGTVFWVDPTRELITILMTQSVPANPDGLRQKFKAFVDQSVVTP
jgi:CubicO group peptidase (beta-lactamase class C family)